VLNNWGVLLLSANSDPRTNGKVMKKKWQRERRRQNSVSQSCGETHPKHGGFWHFGSEKKYYGAGLP
jgi:hypothetical protein